MPRSRLLGIEVQLLKDIEGDGDAVGGADLTESVFAGVRGVEVDLLGVVGGR